MTRKRIAVFVVLAVLPIVLALWLAGFDVSYQLGNYVLTDSAVIAGDVYHASAPTSGQVTDLLADVGDPVEKGQGLASLFAPQRISSSVRAPAPGTIVQMSVVRGQSVAAGQSIATVADLSNLWVVAHIDETSYKDVRLGQRVEVKVNALDRYFGGSVVGVVPDLAGQAQPQRPATASGVRSIAQVPVKVAFDYGNALVYPGMSATVKIFIR